jgi:hypothetical protein
VGVGIAIGTGLGVPIGLAFDNLALGIRKLNAGHEVREWNTECTASISG